MHGAGSVREETATWLNNIVVIARTPMTGTEHIAREAGRQSAPAERIDQRANSQPIMSTRRQCVHVRLHALLVFV
jgi:hypothetical protein